MVRGTLRLGRCYDSKAGESVPSPVDFALVWARGYDNVVVLLLLRRRQDRPTSGVVTASARRGSVPRWLTYWITPMIAGGVLSLTDQSLNKTQWIVLVSLCLLTGGGLGAAFVSWTYAAARGRSIAALAPARRTSRALFGFIEPAYRKRLQLGLAIPVAAVSMGWISVQPLSGGSTAGRLLIVATSLITTIVIANDVYWLITAPLIAYFMLKPVPLDLRWNDPARTPGIRTLSEGYMFAASMLALAAVGVTLPGLLGAPILGDSLKYIYMVLIGLSVWVGVGTQVVTYGVIRRNRLHQLDILARAWKPHLKHEPNFAREPFDTVNDYTAAYAVVAQSPALPFGAGVVLQYAIAVGASFLGFIKR